MTKKVLKEKITIYRKYIEYFSIIVGIFIPIVCFLLLPKMNILFEPLSTFGISDETYLLWFVFIQIISINLFLLNYDRSKCLPLKTLNALSTVSLSMLGIINMNIRYLHNTLAIIFFLSYTAYIFWYGYSIISHNIRHSIISIIISIFIILSSIVSILGFNLGYGIFEVIFILSIIFWNRIVK